ncbi:unnamed protein product [Prunus armeniaca]|uniref:Uncharacterized protein n=1 Tax=Prunus armeniaca TaxID=36596 RepID=A0A6J5TCF9_PRUAR|nr:unnamed protein product [Prunus armeniaca]
MAIVVAVDLVDWASKALVQENIKKGPESIDHYLQKIKDSNDQLSAVGVDISDEDITILTLKGLPAEYNTIKAIIHGRESVLSMKELRSQLKAEESTLEESARQIPLLSAMAATPPVSGSVPPSGMPYAPYSSVPMHPVQYDSPPSSDFRGNNFRDRGKGRMSYNNFQRFSGKSGHYNNSTGWVFFSAYLPNLSQDGSHCCYLSL